MEREKAVSARVPCSTERLVTPGTGSLTTNLGCQSPCLVLVTSASFDWQV